MKELTKIRKEIDKTDELIKKLLKDRLISIEKIKLLKQSKKWPKSDVQDKKREKEIMENLKTDFEKEIFKKILSESRKIQKER